MTKIILITLLFNLSLYAQDVFNDLKIFEGKWVLADEDVNLFEEWIKNSDSSFSGESYFFRDGEKIISEKLYLLKLNNYIVYIAQPGKTNPTLFTIIESDSQLFVIETNEHYIPKRMTSHFINESTVNATIDGEYEAENRSKNFSYKRKKQESHSWPSIAGFSVTFT